MHTYWAIQNMLWTGQSVLIVIGIRYGQVDKSTNSKVPNISPTEYHHGNVQGDGTMDMG